MNIDYSKKSWELLHNLSFFKINVQSTRLLKSWAGLKGLLWRFRHSEHHWKSSVASCLMFISDERHHINYHHFVFQCDCSGPKRLCYDISCRENLKFPLSVFMTLVVALKSNKTFINLNPFQYSFFFIILYFCIQIRFLE